MPRCYSYYTIPSYKWLYEQLKVAWSTMASHSQSPSKQVIKMNFKEIERLFLVSSLPIGTLGASFVCDTMNNIIQAHFCSFENKSPVQWGSDPTPCPQILLYKGSRVYNHHLAAVEYCKHCTSLMSQMLSLCPTWRYRRCCYCIPTLLQLSSSAIREQSCFSLWSTQTMKPSVFLTNTILGEHAAQLPCLTCSWPWRTLQLSDHLDTLTKALLFCITDRYC